MHTCLLHLQLCLFLNNHTNVYAYICMPSMYVGACLHARMHACPLYVYVCPYVMQCTAMQCNAM